MSVLARILEIFILNDINLKFISVTIISIKPHVWQHRFCAFVFKISVFSCFMSEGGFSPHYYGWFH